VLTIASKSARLAVLLTTAMTVLTACNSSMQTASLQCFSIIVKDSNCFILGQITEKINPPQKETNLCTVLKCQFDVTRFLRGEVSADFGEKVEYEEMKKE